MQISEDMIERAASAMYSHGDEGIWEALSKNKRQFWRSYALEALEAALSAAEPVKPVDHVWVICPNGHGKVTHQHFDYCGCCAECGSVLEAFTLPAPSLAVKALEWRRSGWVEAFSQPDEFGFWYAIQPDKPVHGSGEPPFTCMVIWGVPGQTMRKCLGEDFQSVQEAKAAAQADYEARIRSALSAQVQDVAERKPLDLSITKEWFEKRAALEGDHEIGAGRRKLTASIDPTPTELAELHRLAHRIPQGWQLVPKEPTGAMLQSALDACPVAPSDLDSKEADYFCTAGEYRAMLAASENKEG